MNSMRHRFLTGLMASFIALPALAQVVAPPSPAAPAGVDAAVAHHDRKVARRAARHGNYRKAAHASAAANAASTDAAMAPH
jgi:hypothetical protein